MGPFLYYAFIVLAFLAMVIFIEGLYLVWNAYRGPVATDIERRLQAMSAGAASIADVRLLKKRALSETPALERILLRIPRVHVLDRFLLQTGLDINVSTFIAVGVALAAIATATALVFDAGVLIWAIATAAVVGGWVAFLQYSRIRRMHAIEHQLPDALDLMARAMQAGHAFPSALLIVGQEGPQPIASELRTTFDEINFGVSTEAALTGLSTRIKSSDLRLFVVAVIIQRQTGGNLSELLTSIAALMRERQKLVGSVRVLSAEGRISAWILGILPFALVAAISLINPDFIRPLWMDPAGIRLSVVAVALMGLGILWIWRTVNLRI